MSAETDKAMEEALQSAVSRMNKPAPNPLGAFGGMDPIQLLMSVLPKLLEKREDDVQEGVLEKLESLQTDELASLREQLHGARKQLARVVKTQELVLEQLREMREQQTMVANAVLQLADEMHRIQILGTSPDETESDIYSGLSSGPVDPPRRRAVAETKRTQQKPRKNPAQARS